MSRKSRQRMMAGRVRARRNEPRPGPALGDFRDRPREDDAPAWRGLWHLYGECYGDPRACPWHHDDRRNA